MSHGRAEAHNRTLVFSSLALGLFSLATKLGLFVPVQRGVFLCRNVSCVGGLGDIYHAAVRHIRFSCLFLFFFSFLLSGVMTFRVHVVSSAFFPRSPFYPVRLLRLIIPQEVLKNRILLRAPCNGEGRIIFVAEVFGRNVAVLETGLRMCTSKLLRQLVRLVLVLGPVPLLLPTPHEFVL